MNTVASDEWDDYPEPTDCRHDCPRDRGELCQSCDYLDGLELAAELREREAELAAQAAFSQLNWLQRQANEAFQAFLELADLQGWAEEFAYRDCCAWYQDLYRNADPSHAWRHN